jgi:cellulose synthase/poly-beta-1,6-N-acetylglucosamine synthase-like glycosyltransferase
VVILLFVVALGVLLHTYVFYPLSLLGLRRLLGEDAAHPGAATTPSVTLVIAARNEAAVIGAKIENSLSLDYPRDRLQILVVSDASSDGTNDIAASYAGRGVVLFAVEQRLGKVGCLNQALPGVTTDLVVMSDANSLYEPDSLRQLVRHFQDERIGCVCGELRYVNPRRLDAGEGERVYWDYERGIKRLESSLGSLLGANGAIYAYRTPLFQRVDPLMFCDDVIPIRIALSGYRTIYEPAARCTEDAVDEEVEFRRRRRHASFGLRSMGWAIREAGRRGRWLLMYECVSHRVFRWMGAPALLTLLLSSLFLPDSVRWAALSVQGVFYLAAAAGWIGSRLRLRTGPCYLAYYYLVITLAGLLGLGALVLHTDKPYWDPRG